MQRLPSFAWILGALLGGGSCAAQAQSFSAGPFSVDLSHQAAIGAAIRMQDRDNRL